MIAHTYVTTVLSSNNLALWLGYSSDNFQQDMDWKRRENADLTCQICDRPDSFLLEPY